MNYYDMITASLHDVINYITNADMKTKITEDIICGITLTPPKTKIPKRVHR